MITDQSFPCDEPFLREVYAKRWRDIGEVVFVMQAKDDTSPGIRMWEGNRIHVLSSKDYSYLNAARRYATGRVGPVEGIYLEDGPFDMLQVRNDLALGLDAVRLADRHDIPFVYRLSHLKSETLQLGFRNQLPKHSVIDYAIGAVGERVRRVLTKRADAVFTISDAMSSYLVEQGCQTRLEAVPMAADTTINPATIDSRPFQSEWGLEGVPYLVYIGTMNPIRQLEFLFPVLKRIRDEGDDDIKLVMVGGRSESNRERLRAAARESGVAGAVTFTGWVSHETLQQAVVGAKVGLSPIPENYVLRTNSPTKVMEYLNLATPTVATPTPEQKRVLRESGAGKIASRETKEFADAIRQLMADEEHRQRLGRQGREYIVSNRSYDHALERIREVYENM